MAEMFAEKEFTSEATLRGRWYTAQNKSKTPCIIMCHGTSATITMGLSDYASEFQAKGFNVFLFDHAGFGRSEGRDRQTINPWLQAKGIADAVAFVKTKIVITTEKLSFGAIVLLVCLCLQLGLWLRD
jgi:alpha-beta hydrolase superfamily lysophospholipase